MGKGFIAIEDKIVAFLYDNDRTTLKRLKYKGDAPEDFKKLKERRLAERRIMTIKSSRRRTRGKNAGFSPLANMLTLAASERAGRTSSGICELAFCALRRVEHEEVGTCVEQCARTIHYIGCDTDCRAADQSALCILC